MADLTVGISRTMVEALVRKVKTAIKEEAELWQVVQRDTVFMKDEFEMMQSFLKTADWERIKNNVVTTWVSQVRDLSYDAEDCIKSILLLDTNRSLWTVCLRLLASCSCKSEATSPLDQAVAEIELLKARVEEVSNRNIRYSLINDSGSKPAMPQHYSTVSAMGASAVDVLTEAWCNAKKQRGLVDLTMLVTENIDALRVISLWGTGGGLGMTSVIKEAYEKPEICQKFRGRAWLKLAHPFNPHEFIRSLAHQFYGNTWKEHGEEIITGVDVLTGMEAAQGTNLVKEFVQKLNKHRYLVVLEDLSNMAEWHAVRTYLPDGMSGSRIVVSTQQLDIARLCAGQPYQILELKKLPDNHSICAFFNEAFERVEVGMVAGGPSLLEMANEVHLVGCSSDEEKLSNLISSAGHSDRSHVISVWGFPGIGKSALVRTVRHRQESNPTSPFDWYGWVDVSYPFNFSDFCRRMHSYMFEQSQGEYAFMPMKPKPDEEIIQECREFLQHSRCLIAIDGLRSREQWKLIKSLIHGSSKCCILVVTGEESVAKYCTAQDDAAVHRVNALGSEAALELFKQEFRGAGTLRDAHMLKEAKYILAKCGGIPEVIMALARYVASEQKDIRQRKLSHLKDNFIHELETKPEFVSLRDLFSWIHFSFEALPQSIKPCILYLSVFQVKRIRRSHFVRRWIAEGYSKCTDSKTMEDYTGELFDRLGKQTDTMPEWRFNSFFHEYVNSRLMEERVVFFPLVVSVLDGSRSLTTEGVGQHLVIGSSWKRDEEFVLEDLDVSHLQSLTVYGTWKPLFVPYKMKSVRVLDLEGTTHVGFGDDELKRILELLPRLRFLSLRGHGEITRLPDSLSGLKYLQTLDIRHTSVVYIELQKLQELQYIRAGTTAPWMDGRDLAFHDQLAPSNISSCVSYLPRFLRRGPVGPCQGVKMPRDGIHHLKALHTLGAVHINSAGGEAILDDIYRLKQMKKLEVSGINRKNSKRLCHAIINHKNLESLSLQLDKENHVVCWDDISPPSSVRSLKLYGYVEKLSARRFKNLRNLRKLSLEMNSSTLFTENIQLLGSVPSLRALRLHVKQNQEVVLQFSARLFRELQHLEIACRSNLHVIFDEEAMQKLELLKIHCHDGSSLQFSGLKHPVSLNQVRVQGTFDDTLQESWRQQLAEHPRNPALVQIVN